ncbi:hypothetical protein [Actinacidiphila yeochonensis]|uniref:hypothetical protein n=1 Tax=Actinacidiphila yeochonensis TaxID=89050 RepID=UPI000561D826|nr:hypothetical protein [Actinacidiphila yeochonensis]
MIATAIRLARVETGGELAAALLMLLSYPCLVLAALLPNLWFFAVAGVVSYVTDWFLHQRRAYLINRLSKARAGLSLRFLLRELTVVLLMAQLNLANGRAFSAAIVCFLVFYGMQAPHSALVTLIRNRRKLPFGTRNIDLSGLRITDAPPSLLTSRAAEKMLHLDVLAVIGFIAYAKGAATGYAYTGAALTLLLGIAYTLALAPYMARKRLPARTDAALAFMDTWLRSYRPTTVLYFSGSADSAYQVNMWLDTMARLEGERPLVILRERAILLQLADTSVPVLCVPGAVHLMNMDLSTVRVALYPANVGKNIHMLRVPTIKHVFVGHGDSDKVASVNPFSKAYDEVWSAGKAGRDRYELADVGVRDEDIVEVGRPQLAGIAPWDGSAATGTPTILYAPTWEGWTDDPGNTSLILAGQNIVRGLVDGPVPVRVLYKPHPFTGTVDARAKRAHEKVVAILTKANAQRAADPAWAARIAEGAAGQAAARTELARVQTALDALVAEAASTEGDMAVMSREAMTDPGLAARLAELRAEWNAAYWRSLSPWEHKVVTGPMPHLYDCFNESDAMVSDISSVVSDFVATGKPYAITDSAQLGEEEFKRQNTAARAALVLDNQATRVGELVRAVVDPSGDPLTTARREIKQYLLGPDTPPSITRFTQAVRDLAGKAEVRLVQQAAMGQTGETGPVPGTTAEARSELGAAAAEGVPADELAADVREGNSR